VATCIEWSQDLRYFRFGIPWQISVLSEQATFSCPSDIHSLHTTGPTSVFASLRTGAGHLDILCEFVLPSE
jgi:hypothetical protein